MAYIVFTVAIVSVIVSILSTIAHLKYFRFKKLINSLVLFEGGYAGHSGAYFGSDRRAKKRSVPVYLGSGQGWVFR